MDKTCKKAKRTIISFSIVELIMIGENAGHKVKVGNQELLSMESEV